MEKHDGFHQTNGNDAFILRHPTPEPSTWCGWCICYSLLITHSDMFWVWACFRERWQWQRWCTEEAWIILGLQVQYLHMGQQCYHCETLVLSIENRVRLSDNIEYSLFKNNIEFSLTTHLSILFIQRIQTFPLVYICFCESIYLIGE